MMCSHIQMILVFVGSQIRRSERRRVHGSRPRTWWQEITPLLGLKDPSVWARCGCMRCHHRHSEKLYHESLKPPTEGGERK